MSRTNNELAADYGPRGNALYNRLFKDAFAIAEIGEFPPDDTIALARAMTDKIFDALRESQRIRAEDSRQEAAAAL